MKTEPSKLAQLLALRSRSSWAGGASSYRPFIEKSGARKLPDIQSLRSELESIRLGGPELK